MPFDFDKADTLIYSDDPEALSTVMRGSPVHVTTPTNAILYEAEVGGGRKRVFYYHQNFDPTVRVIGVRVVNLAAVAVALRVIAYTEPPAGNVVGVGHRSVVGFLRALIATSWSAVNLQALGQPRHDAMLAVSTARRGQLASAFVEIDAPSASRLKIQVISAASEALLKSVGIDGPLPGAGDGIGRSGVFDLTRHGTTRGDFAQLTWDVNAKPLEISVPDRVPFPNAKVPIVSPGRIPSDAVFGVFTRRTVTFSNRGESDVSVGIYAQACGGDSPGTCMIDQQIIELGTMTSGEHDTRPGYEMATLTIPAATNGSQTIHLLGTVDPSGKSPLSIILAKRGALPRPVTGRQVVFRPGGAPWQA
jgi:hypothetical protein